jgi:stage II sporulation protein P
MVGHLHRLFVILALITALLFNLTGLISYNLFPKTAQVPVLQLVASKLSGDVLLEGMGTVIPYLTHTVQASSKQPKPPLTDRLIQSVTGLMPGDPLSLFGKELPGILAYEQEAQKKEWDDHDLALRMESAAPLQSVAASVPPAVPKQPENTAPTDHKEQAASTKETKEQVREVLVYNTHNRESWLNVTSPLPDTLSVDHKTKNISLVSKRLAKLLNDRGIKAEFLNRDIYQELLDQNKSYPYSYAQSLKAITAAAEKNRKLHYFFDLHRDDSPRERTTATIKGKTYARMMIVIGKGNPNYKENLKIANELTELLNKKYPGITRGVDDKGENEGNGEYNQHVSSGSLLIEVGGTGNTLEECYQTVEAFADIFAEYFWQAERA